MPLLKCATCDSLMAVSASGALAVELQDPHAWSRTRWLCSGCKRSYCHRCEPEPGGGCRGCGAARPDVLDEVAQRAAELAGVPLRKYSTFEFGCARDPAARSVVVHKDAAKPLVQRLRRELPRGLIAFVGTTRWTGTEQHPDQSEVVIALGASPLDCVALARTEPINYGLETPDVIARLEKYHREYGIEVWEAESDSVEFRLLNRPADMKAFCDDLYEFCAELENFCSREDFLKRNDVRNGWIALWWD